MINNLELLGTMDKKNENGKSDSEADKFRLEGNQLVRQGKFFEALIKYNASLCYAESNENFAMIYGNRSIVFLELNLLSQCLNNIRLALEYPNKKVQTLNDCKRKCLELKKVEQKLEDFDFFKLSYEPNPKLPFIIDALKLKTDLKYGRHIVTDQALNVGDIISIEKPFVVTINSNSDIGNGNEVNKFSFCSFCLKHNSFDLIPCADCPRAMYCGEYCKFQAGPQHRQENKIREQLKEFGYEYMTVHVLAKALAIMSGSIDELELLFDECRKSQLQTVFDFDFSSNPQDFAKNQLRAALCLARDEKFASYNFSHCVYEMSTQWDRPADFIQDFFVHCHQILRFNNCDIIKSSPLSKQAIGEGIYLFESLINHSCSSNVMRVVIDGCKSCLVVTKPIAVGEQLFVSYTAPFYSMPINYRQDALKRFRIECNCPACEDPIRYSVHRKLQVIDKPRLEYANGILEKLLNKQIKMNRLELAQLAVDIAAEISCSSVARQAPRFPSLKYFKQKISSTKRFYPVDVSLEHCTLLSCFTHCLNNLEAAGKFL